MKGKIVMNMNGPIDLLGTVVKLMPKIPGVKGNVNISGGEIVKQLKTTDILNSADIQKFAEYLQDGVLEIAYKTGKGQSALSDYSIAVLKLKKDGKVIDKGAVSLTYPGGGYHSVIKARSSSPDNSLHINGFVDTSQCPKVNDVNISLNKREDGRLGLSASIKDKAGFNLLVDENAVRSSNNMKKNQVINFYNQILGMGDAILSNISNVVDKANRIR